jgi:hypothetical protein
LHFSDFYGLALPPLYDGQRVCPVQLENVIDTPDALDDVDVLVLSYEFQKPLAPGIHYDPYHEIRSSWTGRSDTCADHLAEALGADRTRDGVQSIGQGWVRLLPSRPATATPPSSSASCRSTSMPWASTWSPLSGTRCTHPRESVPCTCAPAYPWSR